MTPFSKLYIDDLIRVLYTFPHSQFECFISAMMEAYHQDKNVFVMGNGGSGATASHFACDINKGCALERKKRFKVICLNDNIPTMLAYANDPSYEDVFLETLINFFAPGDLVIGISGSGNSLNVIKAIRYAKAHGGVTVGLCGFSGGRLIKLVDIPILVNIDDMQKVEDVHMMIVHMPCKEFKGN